MQSMVAGSTRSIGGATTAIPAPAAAPLLAAPAAAVPVTASSAAERANREQLPSFTALLKAEFEKHLEKVETISLLMTNIIVLTGSG